MSTDRSSTGYAVTLRYLPGSGFTVEVATADGERRQAPEPLRTLDGAYKRAEKVLVQAGFTVELNG